MRTLTLPLYRQLVFEMFVPPVNGLLSSKLLPKTFFSRLAEKNPSKESSDFALSTLNAILLLHLCDRVTWQQKLLIN